MKALKGLGRMLSEATGSLEDTFVAARVHTKSWEESARLGLIQSRLETIKEVGEELDKLGFEVPADCMTTDTEGNISLDRKKLIESIISESKGKPTN